MHVYPIITVIQYMHIYGDLFLTTPLTFKSEKSLKYFGFLVRLQFCLLLPSHMYQNSFRDNSESYRLCVRWDSLCFFFANKIHEIKFVFD